MSENGYAHFEGNGEGDIEYSKPEGHRGDLTLGEGTRELGIWFGYLLFLEAAKIFVYTACYKNIEDTYIAASMNDCMSSWDVTSQWPAGTNGFLELRKNI